MVRRDGRAAPGIGDRMAELVGKVRDVTSEEAREINLRPTGQQNFDSMTKEEQDAAYGPDVAQALREGKVTLADFVSVEGGFLKAKPAGDVLD